MSKPLALTALRNRVPHQTRSRRLAKPHLAEPLESRLLLAAHVVINEIMYHPGYGEPGDSGYIAENTREEYIELLNTGSSPASLNGWRFSQGVDFTFPDRILAPGQYLVIAADLPAFQAKYPAVSNVIGNWTGTLANNGEDIELENNLGQRVDFVSYATEGDWAKRRRLADPVYPSGITGWRWVSGADAGLKSLELINPAVSNEFGQNWTASNPDNGTPGVPNSAASADIAPMILDVRHQNLIPKSTESVTILARIVDELGTNATVRLYHRTDGATSFNSDPMFDDGQHNDALAGDGLYAAILPPQPNATIVEFFVSATDPGGKTRSWPAPTNDQGTEHAANALYQVDDSTYTGNQPIYRIVTTKAEWDAWYAQMSQGHPANYSNAAMNATFISRDGSGDELRYLAGVRNRGEGTRAAVPHNFQVEFPNDRAWKHYASISLNTQYTWSQVAGNAIFSAAGLPAPYGKPVQVRVNGANLASSAGRQYGSYFLFEPYNSQWADIHFPQDSNGNLYKATMYGTYGPADLRWVPNTNPNASPSWFKNAGYSKQTNSSTDDWTDLVNLLNVLNNTPDDQYTAEVSKVLNVDEWLTYFAVNFLIGNRENSLGGTDDNSNPSIVGDDYSMYSGQFDKRFQLLVHDLDTVLGQGDTAAKIDLPLFPTWKVPTIDKLLKWKDFAPRYFEIIKHQIDTTFNPQNINPLLDQLLAGWIPPSNIAAMKQFVVDRNAWVLSQIPLTISATNPPSTASTSTISLTGLANAITTRSVRVNGALATWSAWEAKWTAPAVPLHGGLNHIIIQAFDANGNETDHTYVLVRYDTPPVTTLPGGTLPSDTTLTANNSPYQLTSSLTIPSGRTLTIQPGASLYLPSGANLVVANGGTLLANGTNDQRIVISSIPGGSDWGNITVNGGPNSPETRIAYTHIAGNGSSAINSLDGTILLDHLTFGNTSRQYLVVDRSSFLVQDCEFPATTASFEPVHGVGNIKTGGRGIFLRNYFGPITGYNDSIDYTGGQRPGPILQIIDNVFAGTGDDNLDVDSTDAWIQGNIFLHIHKNGPPDTSSAVSGGEDTGFTSEVTIINNIIYDVDQVANAKENNFYTLLNNTIVRQTHAGGLDTDGAVIVMQDNGMSEGRGIYLDSNIIYDIEKYLRDPGNAVITFSNNLLPTPWTGPGSANLVADPAFKYLPKLAETYFTNWTQAQIMKDWLSLVPGTPGAATGPNGATKGAIATNGATISGEPLPTTSNTSATLLVGSNFTGNAIPVSTTEFPNGSGYTHYKYRLDSGNWSDEIPISTPITLTQLPDGPHYVEVIGKNDAGLYQNDPALGSSAYISRSRTWTVDSTLPITPHIRINEVLALNTALLHDASLPDMIELYNDGESDFDLSGYSITDNPDAPDKFVFPAGTILPKGQYLVLYADSLSVQHELHLGFSIKDQGDSLTLFSPPATDFTRSVVDSVKFGRQIPNLSIGRLPDASWTLTQPSFGYANVSQPLGDTRNVKINEWLADEKVLFADDFIELHNPSLLPVAIGDCFLTDIPADLPRLFQSNPLAASRYRIRPLTFIPPNANTVLLADSNPAAGANHLDFKLAEQFGTIGLFDQDAHLIDHVLYGDQSTDTSQGRSPDAGQAFAYYPIPLPNVPNPGVQVTMVDTTIPIISSVADGNWRYSYGANLGDAWRAQVYPNEASWSQGAAVLYYRAGSTQTLAAPINTTLAGNPTNLDSSNRPRPYPTYYFRRHFTFNGDPASITHLAGRAVLDDGAILYLNGVEIGRINVDPTTTITYTSTSQDTVNTANTYVNFSFPLTGALTGLLHAGDNVLAVEVKQTDTTSSDVAWGCTLDLKQLSTSTTITNPVPDNIVNLMNQLRITELLYNPIGDSIYEYIELQNTGDSPLDLTGVRLSDGIDFLFPSITLDPHQYVIVAANQAAFESRYGTSFNVAGQYSGFLSNSGDNLTLQLPNPYDAAILRFDYSPAWYPNTYLAGHSLVILNPSASQASWSHKDAWRASAQPGGSPGIDDPAVIPGSVVISEVLANNSSQFVEIHNSTATTINVAGWFLSDDPSNLTKFRIDPIAPATDRLLQPDQYLALTLPFPLASDGGAIYLSDANPDGSIGNYRESFVYSPSHPGISFGRYVKSDASIDFVPTSNPTPNTSNAYPLVGPVVISEIMYHPLAGDEYIELNNITPSPVTLYNPANPADAWSFSSGINYAFSQANSEVVVPPFGYLLVVPILPDDFRAKYNVPNHITILGPYTGALNNGGEILSLARPGNPPSSIVVDSVFFDNDFPWPVTADGTGPSLTRIDPTKFANDPVNWTAATPSPGLPNFDNQPPTATIDAGPDRQEYPPPSISITFSKPVLGFDLSDLTLTRNGLPLSLSTASFTTSDNILWTLANLDPLISSHGQYSLSLNAASASITDLAGQPLTLDAADAFTITTLAVTGSDPSDSFLLSTNNNNLQLHKNGSLIDSAPLTDLTSITLANGNFSANSSLNNLKVSLLSPGPTSLAFTTSQNLASLTLAGGTLATLAPDGGILLHTHTLSLADEAILDLNDNTLIVVDSIPAELVNLVKSARNGGNWSGPGITSTAARLDPYAVTGLAIGLNPAGQTLIKYTYNGDANLDGVVNADDYFRIDSGFITQTGDYANGDFNYDNTIDADDYFLIDSAFIAQTAPLAIPLPSPFASTPLQRIRDAFFSDQTPIW